MTENPPSSTRAVIENREHLLNLLAEAAEIEHNLMCCYLYAAFSLKESVDEGVTETELAAIQRWRRSIIHVAVDEMAHLALVANITAAVGGPPQFGRANFPIPTGSLPAGIVVKLAPFNRDTLDHFVFLERPEGSEVPDGAWFAPPRSYSRVAVPGRLMPSSHDYVTVGELYHSIEAGLERLVEEHGEDCVFAGDPALQLGPEVANLPGLTRVRCLKTARQALDGIVQQGEGAPGHAEDSHFKRFSDMRDEFLALKAARPEFVPARNAAHNPVMRSPATPEDKVHVTLEPAASLLDLVNAAYTHMLRLMVQSYAETRGERAQRVQVDAAIALMFAVTDVASVLTRLPANNAHPGCTAGMSFATLRGATALAVGKTADKVLIERTRAIGSSAERLADVLPNGVPARLTRIAEGLARGLAALDAPKPTQPGGTQKVNADPPPPTKPSAIPTPTVIAEGVEAIEGKALTLIYENQRCIHSRHCVLEQPAVFKANVQGPWIDPDATSVEQLVGLAFRCPSGAIRFKRKDGGEEEPTPPVNLAQVRENGPLGIRAEMLLDGESVPNRATLCRCGGSKRKPFCDGTHKTNGFQASGEPATAESQPLAVRNGPLDIRPQRNGPLQVSGNLELISGTGRTINRLTTVRLCRCGGSANKPYCDGTHARIGFRSSDE